MVESSLDLVQEIQPPVAELVKKRVGVSRLESFSQCCQELSLTRGAESRVYTAISLHSEVYSDAVAHHEVKDASFEKVLLCPELQHGVLYRFLGLVLENVDGVLVLSILGSILGDLQLALRRVGGAVVIQFEHLGGSLVKLLCLLMIHFLRLLHLCHGDEELPTLLELAAGAIDGDRHLELLSCLDRRHLLQNAAGLHVKIGLVGRTHHLLRTISALCVTIRYLLPLPRQLELRGGLLVQLARLLISPGPREAAEKPAALFVFRLLDQCFGHCAQTRESLLGR